MIGVDGGQVDQGVGTFDRGQDTVGVSDDDVGAPVLEQLRQLEADAEAAVNDHVPAPGEQGRVGGGGGQVGDGVQLEKLAAGAR